MKTTALNTFWEYAMRFFMIVDINLLSWNKGKKTGIISINTKLQLSCIYSPESAVCHVRGADNGKKIVCI